jgi:Domain of unknown function (DUF6259)
MLIVVLGVIASLHAESVKSGPSGAKPLVILKNAHLQLAFDSRDGRLETFISLPSGDNYLKGLKSAPPLFEVTVGNLDGTNQQEAYPTSASVSIQGGSARIQASSLELSGKRIAISATVTVRLDSNSAESRWSIELSNHDSMHTIFGLTFARMHGVRLGDRWQDDALYMPFFGGERFPHAVKDFVAIANHSLNRPEWGRKRVTLQNGHYVHELLYAGGASMMWMDYTDAVHGLYLASYDPEFLVTVLHADTEGCAAGTMNLEVRKWITVRPGQDRIFPPMIVAAHGGDWHWAADAYRSWFNTQITLTFDGGSWREKIGGWLVFMKNGYGHVALQFRDLPEVWASEKKLGMDLLIPYGWSRGGFDGYDPEYYPDLDLGGPLEMSRAYHEIKGAGGEIETYLNARIFNLNSIYFKTLGEDWAVRSPDGAKVVEQYKPGSPESFAVMCPSSQGWRDLLADFGRISATQYYSHLIYYDQVAAAPPLACYSTRHGHDQIGLWNREYATLLHDAYEEDRAVDPHIAFMIEGAADLYAPYAFLQGHFDPLYAGTRFAFPELYKYTFPEVIQVTFMVNTRNSPDTLYPNIPVLPHDAAILSICRDIMVGKIFVFMDPVRGDSAWWKEVHKLLALRKAAAPWMGQGVFEDTTDVAGAQPPLEVKTFRLDHGNSRSTMVEVLNQTHASGRQITLKGRSISKVEAFRLQGDGSRSPVSFEIKNGDIVIEAPTEMLSMTIVEGMRK